MVSRSEVQFMLTVDLGTSSGRFIAEKGNGVVFYIITKEIEALYAELEAKEALLVQDLMEFGGRRQFSVADPNGYVLTFSEPFNA
jgi:predicted enzyme related to lactoylglutathione lyase